MINILFVNSIQEQCGVHSYGKRSYSILEKSTKYSFHYCEPQDALTYEWLVLRIRPVAVIFNFHVSTMTWLTDKKYRDEKRYFLFHEGHRLNNLNADYWLNVDCTESDHDNEYSILRPIIETSISHACNNGVPIIGSFGFSFGDKGFGRIVKMVNDQFDEAIIRLHMPRAFFGDKDGEARAGVIPGCFNEIRKQGIKLEITEEWLDDDDLLMFLSENDLNIFLYDEMKGRGLSSVIDYAISIDTPLAINDSWMFRHIQNPEINVANDSLQKIMDNGTWPTLKYRELWNNKNFLDKYEYILDSTL